MIFWNVIDKVSVSLKYIVVYEKFSDFFNRSFDLNII